MSLRPPAVFELRRYTLHPGRRDALIDLFERAFIEPQNALGITLPGLFRDADRPDRFVWMRAFPDMDARRDALEAFYGGNVWRAHRDAANATMNDSDDVFLLQRAPDSPAFGGNAATVHGPLFCAIYRDCIPELRSLTERGARIVATFVTEPAANTFPQLPVREGEHVFVALVDRCERAIVAITNPDEISELIPTTRSSLALEHRAHPGDFAFLAGAWKVKHRRLRTRLRAADDWTAYDGVARGYSLLDGMISTDEIGFADGVTGASFRHLDLARRRWSIYWTTNRSGALFPPVHGGFSGDRGVFYGNDSENGVPVLARYVWCDCTSDSPRWEQAFSVDGGQTWEVNWIMEFTRASQA